MGVHHSRLIERLFAARVSRLDSEELRIDIRGVHSRKLSGKRAYVTGSYAAGVNETGDFNASLGGEIGNQPVVYNVSAYLIGFIRHHSLHYVGCVLLRAIVFDVSARHKLLLLGLPARYLVYATARILVKRYVEFCNQVISAGLYVEGIVLGVMLTAFSAIISQFFDIIESDHIFVLLALVL